MWQQWKPFIISSTTSHWLLLQKARTCALIPPNWAITSIHLQGHPMGFCRKLLEKRIYICFSLFFCLLASALPPTHPHWNQPSLLKITMTPGTMVFLGFVSHSWLPLSFCFLLGGTRVWLRTLLLLSKHSTTWAAFGLFCFIYFQIGSWVLPKTSLRPQSSYLCLPQSWDSIAYYLAQLIYWDGILLYFCPGWAIILIAAILLISASQVAGIIDMSHHAWPLFTL
jgi:hypothetical protein